jgi:hypothetical protein
VSQVESLTRAHQAAEAAARRAPAPGPTIPDQQTPTTPAVGPPTQREEALLERITHLEAQLVEARRKSLARPPPLTPSLSLDQGLASRTGGGPATTGPSASAGPGAQGAMVSAGEGG